MKILYFIVLSLLTFVLTSCEINISASSEGINENNNNNDNNNTAIITIFNQTNTNIWYVSFTSTTIDIDHNNLLEGETIDSQDSYNFTVNSCDNFFTLEVRFANGESKLEADYYIACNQGYDWYINL